MSATEEPIFSPEIQAALESDHPLMGHDDVQEQLLRVARDLNRVLRQERAHAEALERTVAELKESYFETVKMAAFMIEARDSHTRQHLDRSQAYAIALAQRVAPEVAEDDVFRYGFLLHDIGKVGIPDDILRKPSSLSREEWEIMQTHPLIGGQLLARIKFLQPAIPIVECHHEMWDGNGYPRKLSGEDIPVPARIFAVVDTFDAMTSNRPYRRALTVDQAIIEIRRAGGTQLDPVMAVAFAELCAERATTWPLPADHEAEGIH